MILYEFMVCDLYGNLLKKLEKKISMKFHSEIHAETFKSDTNSNSY